MAVVASFTHNGESLIPPSQEVQFTDTSSGSPTNWLWTFGDGGDFSNLQNPTYTFTGESPDTFNVTLKVWKVSSSPGVGMSQIWGSAICSHKVLIGNCTDCGAGFEATFDSWGAGNFQTISNIRRFAGNMVRTFGGPDRREIRAIRTQFSMTPSSDPLVITTVSVPLNAGNSWYNRYPDGSGGTVELRRADPHALFDANLFSTVLTAGAAGFGRTVSFDVSAWGGISSFWMLTSTERTNANKSEDVSYDTGWWADPINVYNHTMASADDIDEDMQTLIFGTPPIADFTGSPLAGGNPLEVQFENLSTEAVGLPTTYSWLKKKSGTADPFVEFSTEENPLESFGK